MADNFQVNCLVDSLAAEVNLAALNPVSQNTYGLSDIVTMMNRELNQGVVPLMKKCGQEYFVYNVDQPIVSAQSAYIIPPRAVGNSCRDIVLLDASGNEVALNNLMREYIKVQFPFNFVPSIWAFGQYMTANEVNLYNTLIQSYVAYKLRFIIERRPGRLTLSTNCGQVTNITGSVVTLSYVDPTWTTATTFDCINNFPPFNSVGDDQTVTLISGFQMTFTKVPSGLSAGMWVCPAMLSCIPQIPYEFFPLLTERTVCALAEGLDMSQLVASSKAKIQEFEGNALSMVSPRVQGSPRVIINRDAFSRLGWGRGGFR